MTDKPIPEIIDDIDDLDFELIIGDEGGRIDNGDVPIRWCAKPDFVHKLKERGIVDPHVLIASYAPRSHSGHERHTIEMDRRLVPLSELMTYLRFTRAGKMKVYGVLLDGAEGRGELHKKWMRKHSGSYDAIVDSYTDNVYNDLEFSVEVTAEFVEIPNGVFGKEPSPWVKWYVNLWHSSKDKITDECDFRKRKLIAIPKTFIFVPYITTIIMARVLASVFLILAGYFKEVRLLRAFRPYKYPSLWWNVFDDGIDWFKGNFFLYYRKNFTGYNSRKQMMLSGIAFAPIVPLVIIGILAVAVQPNGVVGFVSLTAATMAIIFGLLFAVDMFVVFIELMIRVKVGDKIVEGVFRFIERLIKRIPSFSQNDKRVAMISIIGIVGAAVLIALFNYLILFAGLMVAMTLLSIVFFGVLLYSSAYISDWLDKYFALSAKDNNYDNITELLCPKEEDNLRPNYKYIPKKQRTVRLWYHDLKNKVCKPMQQ